MSDGAPRTPAPAEHAGTDPTSLKDPEGSGAETADEPSTATHPAALPATRAYDPPPPTLLQTPKETWEPQQRATRRPDFADRVIRTTEVVVDPKAPAPRKPPPRRTGAITWDDDKSLALRAAPFAQGGFGLSRSQLAVLVCLSALVGLLTVAWVVKSLFSQQRASLPVTVGGARASGETDEGFLAAVSEEDYDEAVAQAKKFLVSESLDELMPLIREPQRVRPLMDEFYKEQPWQPFVVLDVSPRDLFQSNGEMLAGMVELGDEGKRAIAFVRTPEGIKVDWESFVGFGDIPWEQLVTERPTRAVIVRVHLTTDDYFNADFADSTIWAGYRMLSQGGTYRLFGYVRRDTPVYGRLLSMVRPNTFTMPTLRIRFKEAGVAKDQVEIMEVVSAGWVVTAEDLASSAAASGSTPGPVPAPSPPPASAPAPAPAPAPPSAPSPTAR